MQEMRSRFRGALDIAGCSATTLNSLALHSYRKALGDLIAHELHTAGEWPFRDAILSGEDYAHYLELASHPAVTREGLAGILSERDWRELGSALVSDALPITPPATTTIRGPMSAQRRLCDALGDVISGRRYIAL
jgi:hypothetical protein